MFHLWALFSSTLLFVAFCGLIFLFIKKTEIDKELRLFVIYLTIAFIMESVLLFFATKKNNLFFHHIYAPIEFGLLSFLLIQWESKFKKAFIIAAVFYLVYRFGEIFFLEDWFRFNTSSMTVQSLLLFLLATRIFYIIATSSLIPFYRDYRFYIAVGIMTWNGFHAIIFILLSFFELSIGFFFYSLGNILGYLSFFWTSICYYKQKQRILKTFY